VAEWYDNQNMGSAFPLLDYGVQRLANYASNALSNNQNNYSGLEKGMTLGSRRGSIAQDPMELYRTGMSRRDYAPDPNSLATRNSFIHHKYGLPEYQGELTGIPHRGDVSGLANLQEFGTGHFPIASDKKRSFNFPSILNMATEGLGKFRDKFLPTMSPEKRAEVAALGINPDKYGWGTLPGSGLKGQIHNNKVYVANPFGGNLLHNKNLQSYDGSKTIAEMLQKKEDWAGGQFEKYGDTWTDKDHKGISEALYNYYKSTGALQNWQKAAINKPVDTTTVDNMIIDGRSGATTSEGQPGGTGDVYEQHGWTQPTYHEDSTSYRDSESAFGGDFSGAGPSRHARGGRVRFDEGGWGGDESWGEPSSHDFSNDIGSVGDTGSSDAHDFSNDIGDVGNQGYTPPTPGESGLGDIGNINPYRGPSQIDNTDRINTALGNANAVSQLKNFTTTGNVTDLFKPNIPIWGMSYLYDQWKNRNNKEEEQTSLYDPSINNLEAKNVGPALTQQRNFERKDKAPHIYGTLTPLEEKMYQKSLERDREEKIYRMPVLTVAQGGRVGYFDGGIAGLL